MFKKNWCARYGKEIKHFTFDSPSRYKLLNGTIIRLCHKCSIGFELSDWKGKQVNREYLKEWIKHDKDK